MKTSIKKINRLGIEKNLNTLKTDSVILIIDEKVLSLLPNLNLVNKKIITVIVAGGEQVKTFSTYESVSEKILEESPHRDSILVAIGGGATTDLAGFIAATLLRGIKWVAVPTTLLSMVDAGVGGKVAINSKHGKNLLGAFHAPNEVWIDPQFLTTLSEKELSSGKGEIVKYALLDKEIFKLVVNSASMAEIIEACVNYKKKIVEQDFKEKNIRKYLNLGHTFGHAYEKNYQIPHGIAVLYGLKTIVEKYCSKNIKDAYLQIVKKLGLEIYLNQTISYDQKLIEYIKLDKKRISEDKIEIIVLEDIGKPLIMTIEINHL